MTVEELQAFFAVHAQAFNRHDVKAIASHYAEDCVVESPIAGTVVGRHAIEAATRALFTAFPDLKVETDELLIVGDRVVQTGTSSGTDTGGFVGLPATGRPYRIGVVFLFTVRDHRIIRERRTYDFSGFLLQLAGEMRPTMESGRLYREILERAQLEQDVKVAAEIQRALLPELRRKGETFEVAAASLPCRAIGGDFLDYFDLQTGAFAFVLGDVAGKGPPAALVAAQLQGILAAQSYSGRTPAETISFANWALMRRAVESRFATVFCGELSRDGRLTYCNAGHNPAFVVGEQRIDRLAKGGLMLGAFKDTKFEQDAIELGPDDRLVVFSDGVTEALNANGEEFGEERLLSFATGNRTLPPAEFLDCLLETIRAFTVGKAQNDDLTVLVMRAITAV
jgi:sigma-B regulation protein RsbU (phosphoserine phosphatase)